MRTPFKNEKGRMGFNILEVKAKREVYGKQKEGSASNALANFKQVCVMWGLKNFHPPIGKRWREGDNGST